MRFPMFERLNLPCSLNEVVPGRLHPDGRRYLPLIVLRLTLSVIPHIAHEMVTPAILLLGVVDRHHVVDQRQAGVTGAARLVCALSALRLQEPPYRAGFIPEAGWVAGRASTMPTVCGQVAQVITWEADHEQLAYEVLYTELLIDTGLGIVGLRTSATAISLEAQIGKGRLEQGDWVELQRSRIDILGFG